MLKFFHYVLYPIIMITFFSGCAIKSYEKSDSKLVTFKTSKLKFSDVAYFRFDDTSVQVELFSAGQVVERFEIENLVCITQGCMTQSFFNKKYLHESYHDNTLKSIFLGREIFGGVSKKMTKNGFEQKLIDKKRYNIVYRVQNGTIYFKDFKNKILIKIKNIKKHKN